MATSSFSARSVYGVSSICSYACRRALLLAWRARGDMRTHSSSRSSVRWRAWSAFSSWASRACFWSSQEE
jgi:hypothetical protein